MWLFLSCHNALWLFKNSHNTQFRVVAVAVMPQSAVVFFPFNKRFRSLSVTYIHVPLEACISVLVPSQPRFQRVLKEHSANLNLPKREADNSPLSSGKIKNTGTYNPSTPSHFLALAGATTNFIFGRPIIHRGLFQWLLNGVWLGREDAIYSESDI